VLPDAIHNALPAHHPGLVITDITLATCSSLNFLSSCKLDAAKWHRINTDLYLSRGWLQHAYVHIQRKRESDLSDTEWIILDVRVGPQDPGTSEKNQGAERWESRPGGIWLKRSSKRHTSDATKAVTAVDLLFGVDAVEPRPGWHLCKQALLLSSLGDNQEAHLTIRRGPPILVDKPVLRVRKDGKFKILQVADLHLSTGLGVCREPEPPSVDDSGKCEADPRTLAFIRATLELETPDLVVLSGDQVNGETSPDAQSAVFKFANLFIERKIPYATIFGNHDNEGSIVSREALMQLVQTLPYSLAEPGPTNVDGIGNYYIEILGRGTSSHSALTLYFFDTHGYSPDEHHFGGYDWLKKSQIDWFKRTAQGLQPSHAQYTHVHMDMAFIHIPLPEYRNIADIVPTSGSFLEPPTAPGFNSGFKSALVEEGVLAVSCGHDHANDYCALAKGNGGGGDDTDGGKPELWMCYAGGSGFGGYGGYGGYQRRVRVFDFDMNEARIGTWKRVEGGGDGRIASERGKMGTSMTNTTSVDGKVDEITLVEAGKVVSPS
jgi:predicted MPP superfamily phosphohydrolase